MAGHEGRSAGSGVPLQRARHGRGRGENFSTEPAWVGVVLIGSMLLWCAGPWIGGGVLFFAAVIWLRHRYA